VAELVPMKSALDGVLMPGNFGAENPDGPGVTFSERQSLHVYHLSGDLNDARFPTAARHAISLPLPMSAGETRDTGGTRVLWLGPDRWLITATSPLDLSALTEIAAVNDVTAGRLILRLSGPKCRDLLAKGSPLDLNPAMFKAGHCAQTLVGALSVTLDCVAADGFDLYVTRSHALFFWEWLSRAANEFGYRVEAA